MNTMSSHRFEQISRFIHFVDNSKQKRRGQRGWNPLQKIKPFIDKMMSRFRLGYIIGQFLTVDESMIRYKGKQIKFVQYMPAKPIKHGIKVFCLCCAETGYMYGCWVYCGKENDRASPTEIIERLLAQDSDLLGRSNGRVLYTDNYYTSEELIRHMYAIYGMFVVGTMKLTKKLSRTSGDFAFHRLSGPARRSVGRGWVRWAQKKVTDGAGHLMYILQNTTWMDRQQVGVMHNWKVGPAGDCRTLRYDRERRERVPVTSHPIIPDYIRYMRGVDRCDQGMSAWDMTQKCGRWYLSIFYYKVNAALYNMRANVQHIVTEARSLLDIDLEQGYPNADPWHHYLTDNDGWFKWMCDLGLRLIEMGIKMDWHDITDDSKRPKWLRQLPFKPCECGVCFFCMNNLTGKYGQPEKEAPPSSTHGTKRGHPVEVASNEHAEFRERVSLYSVDCGVCVQQGRIRKPKGVERTSEHIVTSALGCPHSDCRRRSVCPEHWQEFQHHWDF